MREKTLTKDNTIFNTHIKINNLIDFPNFENTFLIEKHRAKNGFLVLKIISGNHSKNKKETNEVAANNSKFQLFNFIN